MNRIEVTAADNRTEDFSDATIENLSNTIYVNNNHSFGSADGQLEPVTKQTIELTLYITLEACLAFFAFINNLLVIIALWKFSSLRTPTNWFVASLAIADIAVAVFGIPCAILLRLGLAITTDSCGHDVGGPSVTGSVCLILVSLIIFLTQVSIFSLLLIAIDRFIAINYPFRYATFMTTTKTRVGIMAGWGLGAAIGLAPELGWNKWTHREGLPCRCEFESVISMEYMVYFNFFACVLTPLIVMGVIYLLIFRSAKSQLQKIYADVSKIKRRRTTSKVDLEQLHHATTTALLGLGPGIGDYYKLKPRSATIVPVVIELGSKRSSAAEVSSSAHCLQSEDAGPTNSRDSSEEIEVTTTNGHVGPCDASYNVNEHIAPDHATPEVTHSQINTTTNNTNGHNVHAGNLELVASTNDISTIGTNAHNVPNDTSVTESTGFLPAIQLYGQNGAVSTEGKPQGRNERQKLQARKTFSMEDLSKDRRHKEKISKPHILHKGRNGGIAASKNFAHLLRPNGKSHSFSASTTVPRLHSTRLDREACHVRATPLSRLTNRTSSVDSSRSTLYTSEHGVWTTVESVNSQLQRRMKRKSELIKKEIHAARSLATVVGAFAICWLPLHILNSLTLFCPDCYQPSWLKDLAILFSHANSLINPLIYAFKLRDFRTAFWKILSRIVKSPSRYCDADDTPSDESRRRGVVEQCCFHSSQSEDNRKQSTDSKMTKESKMTSDDSGQIKFPKMKISRADQRNNNNVSDGNMVVEAPEESGASRLCDCLRTKRRPSHGNFSSSRVETEMSMLTSDGSSSGDRGKETLPQKTDSAALPDSSTLVTTSTPSETASSSLLNSSETVL